ncbi:MAG: hypothetical protein JW900_02570 [Anaerolineae bacterium]|nr:hypothetical protein [Anaerolineae bacterium]
MEIAVRITALITWAGIAFLLFMLWRIARFYEISSGKRAYSFLFLPPLVFMPAGSLCYVLLNVDFVGSPLADLLLLLGGVLLAVATFLLGQIMVGER